ncbi:hypothetical protein LNP04_16030 [Chryseobacterium sp. C-71]|uniref:hypothetical protein n=1 Tax=Chryseobacterium sp. C-71 TaxID=2893882 RepID=UPI001E3FEEF0|nr:hypothetical protein [Chryseobacterium sp. C-71]UFH31463.1 hypothetical protein LNP04_16030 [Chryseobacterium sp. C-71]
MKIKQKNLKVKSYRIVKNKTEKDNVFNRADLFINGAEITITIQTTKFGIFKSNVMNYVVDMSSNLITITDEFLSPMDKKMIIQILDNQINVTLGLNAILKIYDVNEEIRNVLIKFINS